jgi:hypothetical protein
MVDRAQTVRPTPEGLALAIDDLIDAKIKAAAHNGIAAVERHSAESAARASDAILDANKKFVVLVEEIKRNWKDRDA